MAKRRSRKRIYGTGDPLDYIPFNIDNLPRNKKVRAIFKEYGLDSWRDIFADWDIVHTDNIDNFRQNAYNTPEEVVKAFNRGGIIAYVKILYNYNTGLYHAYIDY